MVISRSFPRLIVLYLPFSSVKVMGQTLCKGRLKILLCKKLLILSGNNIIEEVKNIGLQTKTQGLAQIFGYSNI